MPAVRLVDTHAHVMDRQFDADRDAVLERAQQAGVAGLICVGYDLPTSRAAVALAARLDWAWATVGVHPNSAAETPTDGFEEIARLAREPRVVGIGETGLDYYRDRTPPRRQREALEWHAELALELDLPLIIHNRLADADVLAALEARGARGVLHCFSSDDPTYLERMLAAGYAVSFAGPLTFKNNGRLTEMAARVPLTRLLVETDCPYLAPMPHRGKRNEPAFVRLTAQRLAELRGLTLEALVDGIWAATRGVFPAIAALEAVHS
jgi:TatD DNase family protein